MRATREGATKRTCPACGQSVLSEVFKSVVLIVVIGEVMLAVSPLPQRSRVQFPSTQQQLTGNVILPNGKGEDIQSSEFDVGNTGIACDKPGAFVKAPDGCNRCFCAENRQLSSACSRVYCPPGFPSSSRGQYRL